MAATFGFALRVVSFVTLPAAAGLILLASRSCGIVHTEIRASSTALTLRPLLFYSLGLPVFAAVRASGARLLLAAGHGDTGAIAAVALAVNIGANTIFLQWLWKSLSNGGPALATALAAYVNICALSVIFGGGFGRVGRAGRCSGRSRESPLRIGDGHRVCARCCAGCVHSLQNYIGSSGNFGGKVTVVAVGVYLSAARTLRCGELNEVLASVRSTFGARSAA